MNVSIKVTAPQSRCYVCGKTEISVICHHCGRAMCSSHGPASLPDSPGALALELSAIGIRELREGQIPSHCEYCLHYVKAPFNFVPEVRIAALILIAGIAAFVVGIANINQQRYGDNSAYTVLIIGGAIAILLSVFSLIARLILRPRSIEAQMLAQRLAFPIMGQQFEVAITEVMRGTISLSDTGGYHEGGVETPTGKFSGKLLLSPRNREQFDNYCEKYQLDTKTDLPASGGTIILRGRPEMRFVTPDANILPDRAQTIVLRSDTSHFLFLTDENNRDREWKVDYEYQCPEAIVGKDRKIPFAIVPTLVTEGTHRAVQIGINLHNPAQLFSGLGEIEKIEEFSLIVPQSLGQIQTVNPSARSNLEQGGDDSESVRRITWRDLTVTSKEKEARRKEFYISFENDVVPETVLRGRIIVQFRGTLSGIEGVTYFNPVGTTQTIPTPSLITRVDITFDLSLENLRFQEDVSLKTTIACEGVSPTYQLITTLTDVLSEQRFYTKQVFENVESPSVKRAYAVNRYWDIEGRVYQGVYPIDFHLVVKGEAVIGPQKDDFQGDTSVEITVKGTITDQEMRQEVENVFEQLKHNTEQVLEQMSQSQPTFAERTTFESANYESEPVSSPSSDFQAGIENNAHNPVFGAVRSAIEEFFKGILVVSIPTESSLNAPLSQSIDQTNVLETPEIRKLSLRKRLEGLTEALIRGTLSETLYLKLRSEIEAELGAVD